jgi:hypothetical protein
LASIALVSEKIAVRRENETIPLKFRQSYQAGIGKGHRHGAVMLDEVENFSPVVTE